MIEFNGKLSGAAEKCFIRKLARDEQITMLIVLGISFPVAIWLAATTTFDPPHTIRSLVILYGIFLAATIIFPYFPGSIKSKRKYMPVRIFANQRHIVCVSSKHTVRKHINDVKLVYDCGEYYDIRFHLGHYSSEFVCQKDLLTKGSLRKFEELFEGKIIHKPI